MLGRLQQVARDKVLTKRDFIHGLHCVVMLCACACTLLSAWDTLVRIVPLPACAATTACVCVCVCVCLCVCVCVCVCASPRALTWARSCTHAGGQDGEWSSLFRPLAPLPLVAHVITTTDDNRFAHVSDRCRALFDELSRLQTRPPTARPDNVHCECDKAGRKRGCVRPRGSRKLSVDHLQKMMLVQVHARSGTNSVAPLDTACMTGHCDDVLATLHKGCYVLDCHHAKASLQLESAPCG